MGLGGRIESLRRSAGLSARELDALAGLQPGHARHIERGKITPDGVGARPIAAIARVLGSSIDWLYTGAGRPPGERTVKVAIEEAREAFRLSEAG